MKLKEAYSILELPETATPEEAKKRYRELAKKHHPDVNKSPDAEATFKKINEAYQIIESGVDPEAQQDWGPFHGNRHGFDPFSTIFNRGNPFGASKRQYYAGNIDIQTTISFRESAQGCKKELTYVRQIKCPHCHGNGNKPVNNGCKKCGGKGQVATRSGGAVFIETCSDCRGKSRTAPCTNCNTTGTTEAEASVHVSVPAAVIDGNVLRLRNVGNFAGTLMGLQDQYSDVLLHIKVAPDPEMRLEGKDIISELNISLLDALQGCSRNITTIDGDKLIDINKGVKNKDEVIISVGDRHNIKHRVVVKVGYPTNIDKLIDVLLEEGR